LDKEELIAIILDVADEEYRAILTVKRKIKGDSLTVDDLERVMSEEFRQLTRNQVRPSVQEDEMLLFKNPGACYNCGKLGHRANECTARKNSDQNQRKITRFQGKCGTCGMKWHASKDCWTREENSDKTKNWRKLSKEKAIIAVESKKNEKIIRYGWAVEDLETTLMDPNIWIADTGATVHSTSNVKLAQDWKQETNNTVFVMGNGQKEEVTKTGKVTATVKNCQEGFQGNITLSVVMFLSNGCYNLISITKVMQSGWKLEGNQNMISLRKHNKILIFDIKVET
jgi:hypothetical protein